MRKNQEPDGSGAVCQPLIRAEYTRLLAVLVLALAVRLFYVVSMPPDSPIASVDAWGYHRLALNLAERNGFSLQRAAPFIPDSVRTPLYPVFLLLIRKVFDSAPRTAVIVQAALDSLTALLTYLLASEIAGRRAGRAAALLYALNPTQVRYVNDLLTETLLSFLLTLCTLSLIKYLHATRYTLHVSRFTFHASPWLAAASLAAGLAILCKPNVQLVPLIWMLAIIMARKRHARRAMADISLLLGVTACILLPWIARNQLVFGRRFLSTAFEGNVSRVSAPATLAQAQMRYPVPWSDEWEGYFLQIVAQAAARYGWTRPWETLTARELDEQNHQVYLVARETLFKHPVAWVTSHLQGMLRYLEPQTYKVCYARFSGRDWPAGIADDVPLHVVRWISGRHWAEAGQLIVKDRWRKLDPLQRTIWWGAFASQMLSLILALRGAWRLRAHPATAAALLLTIAYVLLVPGPIAYERFLAPVTGLILSLIAANLIDKSDKCWTMVERDHPQMTQMTQIAQIKENLR